MGIFGCAVVVEFAATADRHIHVQFFTIGELLDLMRRGRVDIPRIELTISSPAGAHHHSLTQSQFS